MYSILWVSAVFQDRSLISVVSCQSRQRIGYVPFSSFWDPYLTHQWLYKAISVNFKMKTQIYNCTRGRFANHPSYFQITRPDSGTITRYTHKTSGFKTSGFKMSGFKTSETSELQNVRFTKRQVYKMSGLQKVRSSKRPFAKNIHICIFCTCGWWKSTVSVSVAATMFAGKVMFVFYYLF